MFGFIISEFERIVHGSTDFLERPACSEGERGRVEKPQTCKTGLRYACSLEA
jgi:hypothetical protein